MSQFREIVEKVLQQHNIDLNEDAKNDYALIKEAEVVWNMFLDKIKKDGESITNWLNKYEYVFIPPSDNYNNCPALKIYIKSFSHTSGSYNGYFITLYLEDLLYNSWYKKYFLNHNITTDILLKALKLPQIKSTFLHEYQHFKYDLNDKTKNLQYKVNSKEDYNKYRQNHNENNSFTIEDLSNLITDFKFELKYKNIDINNKKEVLNYLSQYIRNLYALIGIKSAYDGHRITNLSEQPMYTKDTHMEKQYYKRIYNLLYYLFVEDNINKARQIYNQIKKDISE